MNGSKHVAILDPMRGVAALAVVIFHFLGSILPTLRPNGIEHLVDHGKIGVQVFFVISGFVIPYAMQRSAYGWSDAGRFMLRRFVRIAPPAYVAALAMIAFHLLAIAINGRPVDGNDYPGLNPRSIFANMTFSVEYLNTMWFNFVYWSLTIEFEFYLVLAALFPLIAPGSPIWRVVLVMGLLLLTCLIPGPAFFRYVEYFVLGMLVYLWRETPAQRILFILLGVGACAVGLVKGAFLPLAVSVVAALIIASGTNRSSRPTDLLGDISYSLYITHVPVAYFAESIIKRVTSLHESLPGKGLLFLVYLAIAIGVAYLFHRTVERPFLKLSKRIGRSARTTVAIA